MLYRDEQGFKLAPYLAKFTQNGEEVEQLVIHKTDLEAFQEMGHISNLSFEESSYGADVLSRYETIKDYPVTEEAAAIQYVDTGAIMPNSKVETDVALQSMQTAVDSVIMSNLLGGL